MANYDEIGGIVYKIGADSSGLESDFDAANKTVEKKSKEAKQTVADSSKEMSGEVGKNIAEAAKNFNKISDAAKESGKSIKFDTSGIDSLVKSQDILNAKIETQSRMLGNMESEYKRVSERYGENSQQALKLQNQMLSTQQSIQGMTDKSDKLTEQILKTEEAMQAEAAKMGALDKSAGKAEDGIDDLGDAAKKSKKHIGDIGDESGRTGSKFDGLGRAAAGLAGKIGGALAIGKIISEVWELGTAFEDSFAKASTLIDTNAVSVDGLKNQILDLSDETNIAADELSASMYNALSAGVKLGDDNKDILDYLGKNAELAKAGFTDIDTTVTTTAKVLNAYKMDVSETDRVHKVLMQTQNNGITTIGELGSCLANVTPTAAALGVSFEELGASIANLTAQGIPAAQATTQLNALFSELGKKGSKSDKALRDMTATVRAATEEELETMRTGFAQAEKAYSKSLDARVKATEKSYSQQQKDLEKAQAAETKALEKASNERLKLIDNEYKEKLKLIDEDKYNQLKAIDDQIAQLNGLTEAEQKAQKEKEEQDKRAELNSAVRTAETAEEKKEAQRALAEYEEGLRLAKIQEERKAQIEELKGQKDIINDKADAEKEALSAEYDAKKEALQEEISLEKEALKEKQNAVKESLQEQKALELEHIREVNEADLEAYRASNEAKLKYAKTGSQDGKGFKELNDAGMGVSEILDMLTSGAEMTDEELTDMFGSLEAGKAALGISGENAELFTQNLEAMSTELDVVGDAASKVSETTSQKLGGAFNDAKNTAIRLFNALSPIIDKALPVLEALIDNLLPPIAQLAETLVPILADVLITVIEPLSELVESWLPLLLEAANLLLPPIAELAQTAIPLIIDVLTVLAEPLKALISKLLPPLSELLSKLSPLFKALMPEIAKVAEVLSTVLASAIDMIVPIIDNLIGMFGGLLDFLSGVFTGDWSKIWSGLVSILEGAINFIPSMLEGVINGAITLLNKLIDGVNGLTENIGIPPIPNIPSVSIPRVELPKYRVGVDYIPSDDFPALLHKGEAVLTAREADIYRQLGGKGSLERMASAPAGMAQTSMSDMVAMLSQERKPDVNIVQNNYSPKVLSAYDNDRNLRQLEQRLRR